MSRKGRVENLKPFKPGQSGNPKGRPKKAYCITDILREQGEIRDVNTEQGRITRAEAIAQRLWLMAMKGDIAALKYIYDRIDGKPLQQIQADVESDNRIEIKIEHVRADEDKNQD